MSTPPEQLFAVASPGVEPVLESECRALTAHCRRVPGGVELAGPEGLHRLANLTLRTASRVLLRAGRFPAPTSQAFGQALRRLSLERFLASAPTARVSVAAPGVHWPVKEVLEQALGVRTRSAGADDDDGDADSGSPGIWVRIEQGEATVSVDTSGGLLHRRGYRQEVSRAPLRESLAAAVLLLAGYDGSQPLCDPMCGSGTLAIEGAWLALRRPPGLERRFAFEHFQGFDAIGFAQEKRALETKILGKLPQPIAASDLHAGALGTARRNAKRAHVLESLRLERLDALTLAPPFPGPGLLVANLPYGIRVGEKSELAQLYTSFVRNLAQRFRGWRSALLVADPQFERITGLTPDAVHPLQNGGIRCRVLVTDL